MKLPLHVVLPAAAVVAISPAAVQAFSFRQGSSVFTGRTMVVSRSHSRAAMLSNSNNAQISMYGSDTDPSSSSKKDKNMWSALANTERWISETLSSNARVGPNGQMENPYTRKEVSYVCETSDEGAMIVAGIFRRLREARELGETHGAAQEENLLEQGDSYSPRTMRQTQVLVLSSSPELSDSFQVFDNLINVINAARRNARDFVTDISLEKLDERMYSDEIGERDWVVSVNCAHLHPKYGEQTPEEILKEMQQEEEEGEVDVNLKAYKERRLAARQSPYPTVVIEVMATPPPDYGNHPPPSKAAAEQDKITSEDVQRLEALFGKSAAMDHPTKSPLAEDDDDDDDAFYEAIGRATGIDEISLVTPIILAQNWVAQHDEAFDVKTSAFTVTDVMHVDAGYEFVFTNLAMQASKFLTEKQDQEAGTRQYMVMSNFVTSSATSFEKFATQVKNVIDALPGLKNKVGVTTFHPEHVSEEKRSPVPIFCIEWKNNL